MKRTFLAILLSALLLPGAVFSAPVKLPSGVARGVSVEGIDEYMLPNGLKVLLFPDQTKPTITVNVTYLVGSRNENYGETGMAHLLEHMMFKGTPRHPNIPQELTAHGTSPNASTSYDRTNYFETFSATDANLDWALGLEADRMVNSNIAKKDLDSEMTVVRNEFESGENNPQSILMERVMSEAYLWHNYGKSIIGARSDIENVPVNRLQAFYHNWYQPDNAVLTVAGDFDEGKTLALIKKKFGHIRRPKRVLQKTYTQDPTQDGEREVTLRRVGDTQEIMAAYHVPASSEKDSAALDILSYVIGDTPSGSLYKALVDTKKASQVFAFNYALREGGLMIFGASVRKDGSLEDVRDELLKLVETASGRDFTRQEVDRAKTALLKDVNLTLKSPDRVGMRLSESIAAGDWRLFFIRRDQLKAVTLDDVKRVADAYLKSSNRTLGLFYPTEKPDRAEIPAAPDVAALVKDYKGGEALSAGEAFDPSVENIDKRTLHDSLKDGMKLAMLPKKTRGSSVRLAMSFKMGSEESLKNMADISSLTGSMLMRGTLHHTRQQIQDEFDRLKTRADIGGGYMVLETDRENLPAALRLAAEVLKEPAFAESEFSTLKQEDLAGIEEQKSDPDALAMQAFYRHMSPYPPEDIRYTPTFDEQIAGVKAVTLDQVKAFHRDFYGASAGQMGIVGDFDPKEFKTQAEELFGGWVSPKPFSRLVYQYKDIAPENINIETPDKANANAYLGVNFAMRDDNPDYPALLLANFITGGGFLNSRLAVRIRQKEGLSYNVGSYVSVNPLDEYARFLAYAIFNPKNAEKLEKAFREELARVEADGFTADEVSQAKDGWRQSRKLSRANDARLASQLASNEYLGRTMAWDGDLEKKVAGLAPGQLKDAFKRYVALDKISFVMAGDFAKAETAAPAAK